MEVGPIKNSNRRRILDVIDSRGHATKSVIVKALNNNVTAAEIQRILKILYDERFITQEGAGEETKIDFRKKFKVNPRVNPGNRIDPVEPEAVIFHRNAAFQDLSNSTNVARNDEFNRYIVATGEINVGEIVFIARPFASVVNRQRNPYCPTCHETDAANLREECPGNCNDVKFCDRNCREADDTHKYVCNTNFHRRLFPEIDVKCAIQMVLKAIAICDGNVAHLQEICRNENVGNVNNAIVNNAIVNKAIVNINDGTSKLRCILNLNVINSTNTAYDFIMQLPKIETLFHTDEQRTLLRQLIAHNLSVLEANAFHIKLGEETGSIIFDTVSLFNHSCSPNVIHFFRKNKMFGVASRHIEAGQQLFITYKYFLDKPIEERRESLQTNWEFDCKCERCVYADREKADITARDIEEANELNLIDLKRDLNDPEWTPQLGAKIIAYRSRLEDYLGNENVLNQFLNLIEADRVIPQVDVHMHEADQGSSGSDHDIAENNSESSDSMIIVLRTDSD